MDFKEGMGKEGAGLGEGEMRVVKIGSKSSSSEEREKSSIPPNQAGTRRTPIKKERFFFIKRNFL
jgi:hypothetical protein